MSATWAPDPAPSGGVRRASTIAEPAAEPAAEAEEVLMSFASHAEGHQVNWLLGNFVQQTDGVRDAVAVSSDGLLIAASGGLGRADADHLTAIVSSLVGVARNASRRHDFDGPKLIMIEMHRGFLLVSVMSGGSCLGVVAGPDSDLGLIGYETTLLTERFGELLTPALISESRQHLPR